MINQYLFFEEQDFSEIDLANVNMREIRIPQTVVHIYEFENNGKDDTDVQAAIKLDNLSKQLENNYHNKYKTILCDSSMFFCSQLYPLIVKFETTLRRVIYISRALFENGKVNSDAFLFDVDKKKRTIEELDFGKIYEVIFTDTDIRNRVKEIHSRNLTKADLIKAINDLEENTMWQRIVGTEYSYIENSFLTIERYRNEVMHSHLIDYETYTSAEVTLENAIKELETVITNKLISNSSTYLNKENIVEAINKVFLAMQRIAGDYQGNTVEKPGIIMKCAESIINSFGTS